MTGYITQNVLIIFFKENESFAEIFIKLWFHLNRLFALIKLETLIAVSS